MKRSAVLFSLALPLLCACQSVETREQRFGAQFPAAVEQPASGSLWPGDEAAARRAGLIGDTVARSRGDIVTVIVRESQLASQREATALDQSTSMKLELSSLKGFPKAFEQGLPGGEASSSRSFSGEGSVDKQGRLEARVTAVVTEVLPNGDLLLEGSRSVTIDDETKELVVRGIARRLDMTASNTILSENLAQAEVSYRGSGPLTRTTKRGLVGRIADFFWHHLWPF